MKRIGVTQRVDIYRDIQERRDCLDQRWHGFLGLCGLMPVLLPNNTDAAEEILSNTDIEGFILTGGNTLAKLGGDAPERDQLEGRLIEYALPKKIPLLGVCRGMQVIQDFYGTALEVVFDHVAVRHPIAGQRGGREVNSYHSFGSYDSPDPLVTLERSEDGVVESIGHKHAPIKGIMWHPERESTPDKQDVLLFKRFFHV